MQPFSARRPVAYFSLLFVGMMFGYVLAGIITTIGHLGQEMQLIISTTGLSLVGLLIIGLNRWWQETGLTTFPQPRGLLLYWLPFLATLQPLTAGINLTGAGPIALTAVMALLVGFVEELWFRGLLMRALRPLGAGYAVFWTTLLFGLAHSLNLIGGQGTLLTIAQVTNALAIGFLLAVLRVRIPSLWPLVIVHALMDFNSWLADGGLHAITEVTPSMLIIPAIFTVAFVVYGTYLWRIRPHNEQTPSKVVA